MRGYLLSISPLLLMHVAIPPVSYFKPFGDFYSLHPIVRKCLLRIYAHTPKTLMSLRGVLGLGFRKRCWDRLIHEGYVDCEWITYLFVHGDYQHLFCNIQALVISGIPIFLRYGSVGLYSIFFLGGAFSVIPGTLFLHENSSSNFSMVISRRVKQFSQSLAVSVGSSGAICAFNGISSVLDANELFCLFRQQNKLKSIDEFKKRDFNLKIFSTVLRLFFAMQYIHNEVSLLPYNSTTSIWEDITGTNESISHSGHVQGFLFGIIAGFTSECLIPLLFNLLRDKRNEDR